MKKKYYITTIQVQVLSDRVVDFGGNLSAVGEAIDTGDCVGQVITLSQEKKTGKEIADLLHSFGSEPGFFQLNDDGNDVD